MKHHFPVLIEIPEGEGLVKYELDKISGRMKVDRFLSVAMHYPCNYGFIPDTLSQDGDPLDVLLLAPHPLQSGCAVEARALAVLRMRDEAGSDDKILALPVEKICAQWKDIRSTSDLMPGILEKISHFFQYYKALEPNKWVEISGWSDVHEAERIIHEAMRSHTQNMESR